jgi:hypothetical protein
MTEKKLEQQMALNNMLSIETHFDKVNWEYWMSLTGWCAEEAAYLFNNIDPDSVKYGLIKLDDETNIRIERTRRIFARAIQMDELAEYTPPKELIIWSVGNKIPHQSEMIQSMGQVDIRNYRDLYRKALLQNKKLKNKIEDMKVGSIDDVDARYLKSLYRIIYIISKNKYEYSASRNNGASSKIFTALKNDNLLSPSDDTIRKILNTAWSHTRENRSDKEEEESRA